MRLRLFALSTLFAAYSFLMTAGADPTGSNGASTSFPLPPPGAPEFAGVGPFILRGVVKDLDGRIVPGATVAIAIPRSSTETIRLASWLPSAATSDTEGKFVFKNLPAGGFVIVATLDQRLGADSVSFHSEQYGRPDHAVVVLEPAGTIGGRILDETGQPVPGATVTHAHPNSETRSGSAFRLGGYIFRSETNANGDFVLSPLVGEQSRLVVAAKGYAMFTTEPILLHSNENEIVLNRRSTIAGKVVQVPGHAELAKVQIALRRHGDTVARMVSDQFGGFAIAGVRDGTYTVETDDPNWTLAGQAPYVDVQNGVPVPEVPLYVEPKRVGEDTTPAPATKEEGVTVSGRVVDTEGAPLENATMWISGGRHSSDVVTDEYGNFAASGYTPGDMLMLRAERFGFHPAEINMILVPKAGLKDIRLVSGVTDRPGEPRWASSSRITPLIGEVVNELGQPVANLEVFDAYWVHTTQRYPGDASRTNALGEFELLGHPDQIEVGGYGKFALEDILICGNGVARARIVLPDRDFHIQGTVQDSEGNARGNTSVDAVLMSEAKRSFSSRHYAYSDSHGRFTFTVHQPGEYQLTAGGYAATQVTATAGDTDVILTVDPPKPPSSIDGRVVWQDNGEPVTHFEFAAYLGDPPQYRRYYDPDGKFQLRSFNAGTVPLKIRAPGGPITAHELVVEQGGAIRDLILEVARPTADTSAPSESIDQPRKDQPRKGRGVLEGRLTLGSDPVAGARVMFGGTFSEGWTDKFGSFRVEGSGQIGSVTVTVLPDDYSVIQYILGASGNVPETGLAHYDLVLPDPAINIEGTITVEGCDDFSTFLKGFSFFRTGETIHFHCTLPRGMKRYAFRGLPANNLGVQASIWTDDSTNAWTEFTNVHPDVAGDYIRDIYLAPKSHLSGVVSGAAADEDVSVVLVPGEIPYEHETPREFYVDLNSLDERSASLGEQQDFHFDDVKMGRYTLFAFCDKYRPARFAHAIVDVAHGEPAVVNLELRE